MQVDFYVVSHASFNLKNPIKSSSFQYDQFGYALDYVDSEFPIVVDRKTTLRLKFRETKWKAWSIMIIFGRA